MDESGGSGQPRSGTDESTERRSTERRTDRTAPATDPARPDPTPTAEPSPDTRPSDTDRDDPEHTSPQPSPAAETDPQDEPSQPQDGDTAAQPSPADDTAPGPTTPPPTEPRPQQPPTTPYPHHTPDTHDRTLAHSGTTKTHPPKRPKEPRGGLLMGRPFGVPVYVAPSWFLVAALITWVFGGQLDRVLPELGAARYLVSLFFAVAFYASVLVHELAHTVAALRFKLPVRRIQLQFFGGVSEIEKEAETPGREFVLAFVGPLLSLVLAGVFYAAMQPVEPGTVPGVLLAGLMISNLIVAAFNLLPGLPLDGGRMLRAVVWKITGKPMTGTIAAAWVGRALAVSVLIGLPWLTQSGALGSDAVDNVGMDTVMDALLAAILAAIIWTGAGNSLRMARLREHLPELRARTLTRRAVPVETDTPLSEALRRANAAGARALVVVDADGNPLSLVREAAIVGVPEHRRPWVPVSGLAQDLTDGMRVSAELAGEDLLEALRAAPATEYLVVEETGEIYGVLSAADVERAFVKAMARPA
ncbi:site-2 protease family protein [Streptomyces sp. NPDC057740]|uniref:site-2 protease family protein n=1 Tax=Streptomyces sp. NPDC057740 TaxID=3346234 RepID=UPI0036CDCE95